ncbi:Na+/H+ antiporter [Spirosoma agri]|uniref:Na+/H+ antiporter n=1 Tax=Spirosoma agri TaxID=1987381 RepID=A0A6M0IIE1_9BACT|nr:Na+/H+ antiporter [Spirosoma agri]NEU68046.1 Na+/H+ antiporter [Spirosoma agri]
MLHLFPYYLALIIIIVLLIMLANRIKVAYPILLVLAGLGISFVPGVPLIQIDPELIFVIFLPPLLYEAAWAISWKELWKWRRIIGSFAFIVVFLTSFAVAWASSMFVPGFTLALGFLLGGIVSPPDAVSAGAILKFVNIPKRLESMLQGESLLNDASSLIIFRFALIAVSTGHFIVQDAALSFGWMVFGGVAIGLAIAYLFFKLHTLLPTDANTDLVLTLVAPYVMYIAAESVHSSGVLSVVSGGLLLSQRRHLFLSSTSRLRAVNVWESLSFILNGLVFMLIGLDLPEITAGLDGVSTITAVGYGLLITAVLIISRLLSAFGAIVVTMIARNFITVADSTYPGIKGPFVLGWAGMRGVVSLAAALSIPVHLSDGVAFPQRNLILFITFIVILSTLLLQGLTLPYLIRVFRLPDSDHHLPEEEDYHLMYKKLVAESLTHLKTEYAAQVNEHPALQQLVRKWEDSNQLLDDELQTSDHKAIYLQLLDQQRQWLRQWNKDPVTNEEVVRKHLLRLDLEEERVHYL